MIPKIIRVEYSKIHKIISLILLNLLIEMEYKYHTFAWGLIFARMLKDRNKFMRHSEGQPRVDVMNLLNCSLEMYK